MELTDAVRRTFGRHLVLILAFVVVGVALAFAMHIGDPTLYQATTRIVIGTEDPTNQEGSQAIADTARGIATGPGLIKQALDELGVSRDPYDIAQHHLTVEPLGSSGVLALTVTDTDKHVAVDVADKIAGLVVAARNEIDASGPSAAITRLRQESDQLAERIAGISNRVDELSAEIVSSSSAQRIQDLEAERSKLNSLRASLVSQQTALQSQSATIASQGALLPQASIVEPASLSPHTVPSGLVPDAVLGAILGMLVGVMLAAFIEIFRPSVVGRGAFEREVGAPVLVEIPGTLRDIGRLDRLAVTMHLDQAAASKEVRHVALIGAEPKADLTELARFLTTSVPLGRDGKVAVDVTKTYAPPMNGSSVNGNGQTGLVLVTPSTVRRSELRSVMDWLTFSRSPLIGIITYEWQRIPWMHRHASPPPKPERPDQQPQKKAAAKR
jgi:uncharacterized protein involved in exopolysaccharide biosynthesis